MIDTEDYGLFREIALEDVRVEDGWHEIVIEGNKNWTDFLHTLNQKEPCLHHTYRITSVEIQGDEALGRMSRLEPNRIGTHPGCRKQRASPNMVVSSGNGWSSLVRST